MLARVRNRFDYYSREAIRSFAGRDPPRFDIVEYRAGVAVAAKGFHLKGWVDERVASGKRVALSPGEHGVFAEGNGKTPGDSHRVRAAFSSGGRLENFPSQFLWISLIKTIRPAFFSRAHLLLKSSFANKVVSWDVYDKPITISPLRFD
jgi:hypothetical protein